VGAAFPYSSKATDEFLGFQPETYCSPETALDLACEAFIRAKVESFVEGVSRPAVGLAVTASVASLEPHRGDHRAHLALVTDIEGDGHLIQNLVLKKGTGLQARLKDDQVICDTAISMLSVSLIGSMWEVCDSEILRKQILKRPCFYGSRIFHGARTRGPLPPSRPASDRIFFPGSFNPIHDGHRHMAKDLARTTGEEPVFMVCTTHVHKPAMKATDVLERAAMFRAEAHVSRTENHPRRTVVFTEGDPLFVDKLRAFPGCRWIVGADTLLRLLDPQWGPSTAEVVECIEQTGSYFFVFSCRWEDGYLDVQKVLAHYAGVARLYLRCEDAGPSPDVRSSRIREQQATGVGDS
jgi:hypothetical protein